MFFLRQRPEEVEQLPNLGGQIQRYLHRFEQAVVALGQPEHVVNHLGQTFLLFQIGVQELTIFVQCSGLAQRHLSLGDEIGQRGS